jgi:hypothetical protein
LVSTGPCPLGRYADPFSGAAMWAPAKCGELPPDERLRYPNGCRSGRRLEVWISRACCLLDLPVAVEMGLQVGLVGVP